MFKPLILIVAACLALCVVQGCDRGTQSEQKACPETPDSSTSVETKKKKAADPVCRAAKDNTRFSAEKWLKSDRKFIARCYPNRISEYDPIIKKMARRYGFDWRLIAAQIYVESNFKNVAKSASGARGLMQVLPSTAKFMGFSPSKLTIPETNIAIGCLYDQRMYCLWGKQTNDYNRLAFALASYNAGRGRVLKSYSSKDSLVTWKKVHPLLPEETQDYVHKIYLKHELYKHHIIP